MSRRGSSRTPMTSPPDAPVYFPPTIKSRDLPIKEKEWSLVGLRLRRKGRTRLHVVPQAGGDIYEYFRRRKLWIFKGHSGYVEICPK